MKSIGKLFISGKWVEGKGDSFTSLSSVDNHTVWEGKAANLKDVEIACDAAFEGFREWSNFTETDRIVILKKFCGIVEARLDVIAEAISHEIGKPLWESKTEVKAIIAKLEPSIKAFDERCHTFNANGGAITRFRPLGPVAVIGPYNFPIHMPNVHIVPALLAGNSVVLKQSQLAPLSGQLYMECWS
jgi:succinylglutamic semialdehyde dehydrogenase